jgi:hypothetical protein
MRAFRIIRLFGRLSSLRDIMKALMCSWMPVVNAMMIVFFTTAVYAILANEFFRDMSPFHFSTCAPSTPQLPASTEEDLRKRKCCRTVQLCTVEMNGHSYYRQEKVRR